MHLLPFVLWTHSQCHGHSTLCSPYAIVISVNDLDFPVKYLFTQENHLIAEGTLNKRLLLFYGVGYWRRQEELGVGKILRTESQ